MHLTSKLIQLHSRACSPLRTSYARDTLLHHTADCSILSSPTSQLVADVNAGWISFVLTTQSYE